MPQGSGLDLFEWVKAYYPRTECIFVTCHDEYSYLRAAMQLGSCDYILKPVDYDQLKETLKEIVQRIARREQSASRQRNDDPMPFHGAWRIIQQPVYRQHYYLHFSSSDRTDCDCGSGGGPAFESSICNAAVQKRDGMSNPAVYYGPTHCPVRSLSGRNQHFRNRRCRLMRF